MMSGKQERKVHQREVALRVAEGDIMTRTSIDKVRERSTLVRDRVAISGG